MNSSLSVWHDQVALVTGGSSGIGLAIARLLAEQRARVWILARRPEALKDAVEAIRSQTGQECRALSADVSDWEQVQEAVDRIAQEAGVPSLLVNSAGVTHPGYFQELNIEVFRQMMEINYFGTLHVTKAVLPGMLGRGSGHIINISSLAGVIGIIGYTAYAASKYAVRGLTDALRSELKPAGIRVSIVYPADTDTPQLAYEKQFKPPEAEALASMSGVMSPEYVAEVILREAAQGRYVITPGLECSFWYRLYGLAGSLAYPVIDYLVSRTQRNLRKVSSQE